MAFFGVTVETIESISAHPNADKLSVAKLNGLDFQFVVAKDTYTAGETVLYFPIDSIIPINFLEKFGLVKDGKGLLAGKQGNRVKTKDIRGVLSRGIVAKYHHAHDFDALDHGDLTKYFGVEKYEPPTVLEKGANLLPLPQHVQDIVGARYDIESTDRHADVVDILMDIPVYVTEKLEGQNFSVTATPQGEVFVSQRNYTIKPIEGHTHSFWKVATDSGILGAAKRLAKTEPVTIFGEFVGPAVQDNIYHLAKHEVYIFDIAVGNRFLSYEELRSEVFASDLKLVPTIFGASGILTLREFLNGKPVKEVAGGKSVLYDTLREGIVIKPITEMTIPKFGRAIIKKRDELYESIRG
jgi:RNA ligase (TIGR02306 family)